MNDQARTGEAAPTTPAMNAAPTTQLATNNGKLVARFAERYGVDANKLLSTLKATAFKQRNNKEVTNEQMMALLVVADQYKLNPFTKEIFAFEDKGNIIPVVSVDGWSRIINTHDDYDGIEFRYSDTVYTPPGGKLTPDWCEAVIHHKSRTRPTVIREYLDEVYVGARGNPPSPGPWQTHTKRMLRHKTLIQGARVAFGFSGIYDEDEAQRIVEVTVIPDAATTGSTTTLEEQLKARAAAAEPVDAEFTDIPEGKPLEPGDEGYIAPVTDEEPTIVVDPDLLDPVVLEAKIKGATDDDAISDLINAISALTDAEARRDLTRMALNRKTELMRETGRI